MLIKIFYTSAHNLFGVTEKIELISKNFMKVKTFLNSDFKLYYLKSKIWQIIQFVKHSKSQTNPFYHINSGSDTAVEINADLDI